MSGLSKLYRFDQSAVIQAGAGTGKTHSLVTLCLHLLGGAGGREPLAPARLCAVTFTEKAGAELRGRLRSRVDRLAACPDEALEALCAEHEPELLATCREAGTALPAQGVWRKVRRELGQAEIGTLHGLCTRLLRRNAAAAGLDPDFAVLDEADCTARRREACERAALDALDSPESEGAPAAAAAERLCRELGLRGTGPSAAGLSEQLGSLLLQVGESGREPEALVEGTKGLVVAFAVEQDAAARSAFEHAVEALRLALCAPGARASKTGDHATRALLLLDQEGLAALRATPPGGLQGAWRLLGGALDGLEKRGNLGPAIAGLQAAAQALLAGDASVRACGLARDLALLAGHALRRYREEKARAGGLDFDDLTRLARDLLARDLVVRRAEKARLGALLVDEFQDTSHAQLELIGWLAEPAEADGTAPAGSGLPGALPIPPGRLALVGDQKQSIYQFRGADLASARAFAARALQDGAGRYLLRTSRRSVGPLVDFVNLLFRAALGDGGRPFDAPFLLGEDDLIAVRDGPAALSPEGPCAELLDAGALTLDDEAEAVARRIAQLLADGAPERIRERAPEGGPERTRPVRGGDVAILLRSFSHVEAFRAALLRQRVPHLVLKGRGFHETREVGDLRALLRLCADPADREALVTVLRSPLGPLSDDALVLLARSPGSSLSLRALGDERVRALLAPDDAGTALALHTLLNRLSREEARLGPRALLEVALAETGYRAALSGGLFGEQAVANVERLLELARSLEQGHLLAQPGGPLRALLARLDAMETERGEPEAPVVEERDPHAVRLLTIHAAKGLEFPVAVVPLCAMQPASFEAPLNDPDLGLALKVRGADGGWNLGLHGRSVKERRDDRQLAEGRRLFYVAATRARDRLIFSSRVQRGGKETWRNLLDRISAEAVSAGLLRITDSQTQLAPPALPRGPAAESLELSSDEPIPDEASTAVARVLRRLEAPADQGTLVAPVTQLADAVACPERYRLLHEVRLEERPRAQAPDEDEGDATGEAPGASEQDELPLPATERGTLAHRLLEEVSLEAGLPAMQQWLRAQLEPQGQGQDPAQLAEIVEAVAGFLDSPTGRALARVGRETPERLLRELPFALQLAPTEGEPAGPRLLVRGQLDALLLDQGRATVLDYKYARSGRPERYDLQLDAYALAAHQLTGGTLPVEAGLVFLRSRGAPIVLRPPATEQSRSQTRAALLGAARSIAEGRRTGRFGKLVPDGCRAISCGFIRRCHPQVL